MAVDDDGELYVPSKVRPMATVFLHGDPAGFIIGETPEEAVAQEPSRGGWVHYTLANDSDWNGRTVFIKEARISAISPSNNRVED
jgi:hypothetical protein